MKPATIWPYLLSGALLAGITPVLACWPVAFIAFVPMLAAIYYDFKRDQGTYLGVFVKGFLGGSIFALAELYWITPLSFPGQILSVALIASLFGLFCMGVRGALESGLKGAALGLWTAFLWVALEAAASDLFSDLFFAIPSLAVGQFLWPCPLIIQFADIAGVWGVSFWIIMTNTCIAQCLFRGVKESLPYVLATILFSLGVVGYGVWNYHLRAEEPEGALSLVLLHTSVKETQQSDAGFSEKILEHFKAKTRKAVQSLGQKQDLIVWPETSLPVFLRSIRSKNLIQDLLALAKESDAPILLGARSFKRDTTGALKLYNAAFMIPQRGYIRQEYHKVILAPFVENNPIKKWMPAGLKGKFKSRLDPGNKPGIMTLDDKKKIGVAICYEGLFPNLIRKCVNQGAGVIINITNDQPAFGNLLQAYKLPLPHVVFRAIENRRALVRCANWGMSLFITPQGKIIQAREVGDSGVMQGKLPYLSRITFFTLYGFWVPKLFLAVSCLWSTMLLARRFRGQQR
jgi:apolipoprotein N-acyltransferase